jgi:hypothetical protein
VDFGSWFDGQCQWVVGMRVPMSATEVLILPADGYLAPAAGKEQVINFGPKDQADQSQVYMPSPPFPKAGGQAVPRKWGPSSQHPGGVVVHVYVDNHASVISDKIAPHLYYRLITRNGNEPSSEE